MTKRLLKTITLFSFLLFFIITSCKKYPEGPILSLRTKSQRVVGDWTVEYFSIDGFDSTTYLQNLLTGTYSFTDKKADRPSLFSFKSTGKDTSHQFFNAGYWNFKNDKNQVEIAPVYTSPSWREFNLGLYNEQQITLWDIQRLTNKEMWLSGTYPDGRKYYIKLKNASK